jgi:hypothetical protein
MKFIFLVLIIFHLNVQQDFYFGEVDEDENYKNGLLFTQTIFNDDFFN